MRPDRRNFLALARQRPARRGETALNQVVHEALELVAYPVRVDGVEVVLDLAPDLPVLWADADQLHQVVVNLLTNAHQALRQVPPPRRLEVRTRLEVARGRIRLEVADTGPGIPPEIQPRIFEPFFTTRPPGQETGLGLSLCQGIVEGHGGTIEVESSPGRGALFRVELPLAVGPAAGEPDEPAATPGAAPAGGPAAGRRLVILVVDDEREVASLLAVRPGPGRPRGGHGRQRRGGPRPARRAPLRRGAERPPDAGARRARALPRADPARPGAGPALRGPDRGRAGPRHRRLPGGTRASRP